MLFIYYCEAVTQWKDYFFHTVVSGYLVVEVKNTLGLGIYFFPGFHHFAIPQCVVGNYETARSNVVKYQVVVFAILAFVGIDENEVECAAGFTTA